MADSHAPNECAGSVGGTAAALTHGTERLLPLFGGGGVMAQAHVEKYTSAVGGAAAMLTHGCGSDAAAPWRQRCDSG